MVRRTDLEPHQAVLISPTILNQVWFSKPDGTCLFASASSSSSSFPISTTCFAARAWTTALCFRRVLHLTAYDSRFLSLGHITFDDGRWDKGPSLTVSCAVQHRVCVPHVVLNSDADIWVVGVSISVYKPSMVIRTRFFTVHRDRFAGYYGECVVR
ncbi:hypothetical protein LZ31DRAFT_245531 [Colletotrichum somersetense]|nr:hypothetical protein LZ31DRAFT_245531 [Colletotrichum somersetense]